MSRKTFGHFTDFELKEAVELMIRPEWLVERGALIALLKHFDFNGDDVDEVLASGEPLNDAPGKLCLTSLWEWRREEADGACRQ